MLFDDVWARFYTWYNEAKIPKITDRQFVVDVDEKAKDEHKMEQDSIPEWTYKKLRPNPANIQVRKP